MNIVGNSQPITPLLKRAIIMLILIVMVGLVFTPADKAVARRVHTNDYTHQYNWDQYHLDNIEVPVELPDPVSPDYTFKDEDSGVYLSHYPEGSSDTETDSEEFVAPEIEALVLNRGDECLHEEGSCEACDTLRGMYHSGEINALYCVSIVPGIEGDTQYELSVPLEEKMREYTVYRCVGGELTTSYNPIYAGSNPDFGFNSVHFRGDSRALQSPYGVVYNVGKPEETSALSVHAYTPDDDEPDDDEPSLLDRILGVLMIVAGLAAFFAVIYFAAVLWEKIKYRLFVNRFK